MICFYSVIVCRFSRYFFNLIRLLLKSMSTNSSDVWEYDISAAVIKLCILESRWKMVVSPVVLLKYGTVLGLILVHLVVFVVHYNSLIVLNCCSILTSSRVLLYSCVLSTAFYRINEWTNEHRLQLFLDSWVTIMLYLLNLTMFCNAV